MTRALPWLSVLTSSGTLVCCALPATMVALGAGATLVGLFGAVPQLVWLSEQKAIVFAVAGAMLAVAGFVQYRARVAPCPADPALALACERMRRTSRRVYGVSVSIFALGLFFAFVAPNL